MWCVQDHNYFTSLELTVMAMHSTFQPHEGIFKIWRSLREQDNSLYPECILHYFYGCYLGIEWLYCVSSHVCCFHNNQCYGVSYRLKWTGHLSCIPAQSIGGFTRVFLRAPFTEWNVMRPVEDGMSRNISLPNTIITIYNHKAHNMFKTVLVTWIHWLKKYIAGS